MELDDKIEGDVKIVKYVAKTIPNFSGNVKFL